MNAQNKPLVSICSITYNHAPYIRQCLDGMLMQKTDFKYEIIINDDCSTDGTTEIVKEYASKYPDIVKPVFHKENQYSKGVRGIFELFVYPKAQGKYIAICEGDDYWIDPLKLQKQVNALEKNLQCSMCFHVVHCVHENGEPLNKYYPLKHNDLNIGVIPKNDIAKMIFAKRDFFQVNSYLFRAKFLDSVSKSPYRHFYNGDFALVRTLLEKGDFYYIPKPMSCYRTGSINGWSYKMKQWTNRKFDEHLYEMMKGDMVFDECTNKRYHKQIIQGIINYVGTIHRHDQKFAYEILESFSITQTEYRRSLSVVTLLKIYLSHYPLLYNFLKMINSILGPKV